MSAYMLTLPDDDVAWEDLEIIKVTPAVDPVAEERAITARLVRDLQQIFYDVDRECIRINLGLVQEEVVD